MLFTFAAILLSAPALAGQQPNDATLLGVVHDAAGKPAGGVRVLLEGKSLPASRDTITDAAGRFRFSGVAMGEFTLTASSRSLHSAAIAITVATLGQQPPIDLLVGAAGVRQSASASPNASQTMQFADDPNFSIAAVTDWTAAGGHGSDAILRTSEALTRQVVTLKSGEPQHGTTSLSGGGIGLHESETALRASVANDPKAFQPNFRLGQFLLHAGRDRDAIPLLQTAYQAEPENYDNEYDLAQALEMTGDVAQARDHVRRLLARRPGADLHRMEGELDEKLGDPLSAVREFQQAASEGPSEENYFAWGSELLFHRAIWQAKEVFDEGARLYPNSARMLTARGAALFAGALYDQAAVDLCKASDLDPANPEPYLFIGKIDIAAPDPLPCVVTKLARFEKLRPASSLANYYYAMALWKQQGQSRDAQTLGKVKAMFTRAVTLDPRCADGYLQLGNLSAGQKQWDDAIGLYRKAIEANSELSEAHYRLGVTYERIGEQAKAKVQFQLHDAIAKRQAAEIQRQRLAVKQFLVVSPGQTAKQQAR